MTSYIKQGDCLELMKEIPDESVDLVATDPPYKIVPGGRNSGIGFGWKNRNEYVTTGKLFKHNDISFKEWIPEIYRVLKNGSHCYIMINPRNLKDLQIACEESGFKFQQLIVWDKNRKVVNNWYLNSYELILMLRKGRAVPIKEKGTSNILRIPYVKDRQHPTEKPVDLMKKLIINSSDENEIVLDPFMGVGPTPIAAINTNRQYIGFELDEAYFFTAKTRIEEAERKKVLS